MFSYTNLLLLERLTKQSSFWDKSGNARTQCAQEEAYPAGNRRWRNWLRRMHCRCSMGKFPSVIGSVYYRCRQRGHRPGERWGCRLVSARAQWVHVVHANGGHTGARHENNARCKVLACARKCEGESPILNLHVKVWCNTIRIIVESQVTR